MQVTVLLCFPTGTRGNWCTLRTREPKEYCQHCDSLEGPLHTGCTLRPLEDIHARTSTATPSARSWQRPNGAGAHGGCAALGPACSSPVGCGLCSVRADRRACVLGVAVVCRSRPEGTLHKGGGCGGMLETCGRRVSAPGTCRANFLSSSPSSPHFPYILFPHWGHVAVSKRTLLHYVTLHPILFTWDVVLSRHYGCGLTRNERFFVHLQLWFVVSFVLTLPGLEEGVIFSGKTLG